MADYDAVPADERDGDPLVSIVTVVYNGAEFLERAIDSVAAQDYPHIEYIVIDGGSTDGTLDIIRRRSDVVTHWISEPDDGIYDAMNKGIARSRGQLIKLLNADDELTEGSVRAALELWEERGRMVTVSGEIEVIDAAGSVLKRMDGSRSIEPVGAVLHPSWYVPRELYLEHGLYTTSYRVSADYELMLRLHHAGASFAYLPAALVRFRSGGISNTTMIGVRERYDATRRYFSEPTAIRCFAIQSYKKLRARALIRLLGEHRMYRLRSRLRWAL